MESTVNLTAIVISLKKMHLSTEGIDRFTIVVIEMFIKLLSVVRAEVDRAITFLSGMIFG